MLYPYIAIGLIAFFLIYLLYHLIRKDKQKVRVVLLPGLFFIVTWVIIYYSFLR